MDEETTRTELALLREFISQNLTAGGVVQQEAKKALARIEDKLASMATLSLSILGTDGNQMTLKVPASSSLQELHQRIQAAFLTPITRLRNTRTNTTFSTFPPSSLSSHDLQSGDTLVCVASAPTWLARLQASGIIPSSPQQASKLLLHGLLLQHQFQHVEEGQSSVPGFAAPIIAVSGFISSSWVDKPLLYRHKSTPSKLYTLNCVCSSVMTFTLSVKLTALVSITIQQDQIDTSRLNNLTVDTIEEQFPAVFEHYQNIAESLAKQLSQHGITASVAESPQQHTPPLVTTASSASATSGFAAPRYPTLVPPIGSSDAHPPLPSFHPSPYAPDGGSLVGPDHPIFGDTHRVGYPPGYDPGYGIMPGGYPAGGIPGQVPYPRYDPIIPTGPRGPMPRGPPRGLHPGEPNPDHFQPPNNLFDRR